MTSISNNISNLINSSTESNNSYMNKQNEVKQIIDSETNRLNQIQDQIDNSYNTKKREIEFNDSYQKRHMDYIKILLTFIVTLLIMIVIWWFESIFFFIPSSIFTLLMILIGSIGTIYMIIIYQGILSRDPINYDQIRVSAPPGAGTTPASLAQSKYNAAQAGNLSGVTYNPNACVGEECCSTVNGLIWDASNNVCTIAPPTTPTTKQDGFTIIGNNEKNLPFVNVDHIGVNHTTWNIIPDHILERKKLDEEYAKSHGLVN